MKLLACFTSSHITYQLSDTRKVKIFDYDSHNNEMSFTVETRGNRREIVAVRDKGLRESQLIFLLVVW